MNLNFFMSLTAQNSPILVIGYGNKEKRDEGVGCHIAEALQQKKLKNIRALSVSELLPNLSVEISKAKITLFVTS